MALYEMNVTERTYTLELEGLEFESWILFVSGKIYYVFCVQWGIGSTYL